MRSQLLCLAVLFCLTSSTAQAAGFQVNRYEPTTAGEWSFAVDHPWYSKTRFFAAGLTLNYGHNPLVYGAPNGTSNAVLSHHFLGHLDIAGSFLDRILLSVSLPVTLAERGQRAFGVAPIDGAAVGDPRIGLALRLYGQPYRTPFSISIGGSVWIPLNGTAGPAQLGDDGVRAAPRIMLGGIGGHVMWSLVAGYYHRPERTLGAPPSDTYASSGPEVQFGGSLKYASLEHRLALGPEVLFSTQVMNDNAFRAGRMGLDFLVGFHYNIARLFQIGLGGGVGLLRQPGTTDGRLLLRLAYAPMRAAPQRLPSREPAADRDGDGIADRDDACPQQAGVASADASKHGCPRVTDRDGDGVSDGEDLCPEIAQGDRPDAQRLGCPLSDRDGDGIADRDDICVMQPMGSRPDAQRLGCPLSDRDGDGVADREDICLEVAQGPNPDPQRRGCPDLDSDGDGVFDAKDQCRLVPAGTAPWTERPGCPLPDKDGDLIPDNVDACPGKPGAPSTDPRKHGCPGLVELTENAIVIRKEVYFATGKDVIQKKSFPVLTAVAEVMKAVPSIARVVIEGHTDDKGDPQMNTELSDRRARSVMSWLIERGIEPGRLDAKGFGPSQPIADNKTAKGRAANRRVAFRIAGGSKP